MFKVLPIPAIDEAAFASTDNPALTAAYPLATGMDDPASPRQDQIIGMVSTQSLHVSL
jgi:hypothetical protein